MYVRESFCRKSARWAARFGTLLVTGCGTAFGPGGGGESRPTLDLSTLGLDSDSTYYETDSNDLLELAEPVEITEEPRVIRGRISAGDDVDVYNLGPVQPGERVLVSMTAEDTLDGAIAQFDGAGSALLVNDHRNVYLGRAEPYIDVVIQRASNACFVAISATPGFDASGDYALVASKEDTNKLPELRPDAVLLIFDGGSRVSVGSRPPVDVPVFSAADISDSYAGQTASMTARIVAGVREDFAGYDVLIYSTSEGASPNDGMTRVYLGAFDLALLGVAEGVDEFNAVSGQRAIVFTDTFEAFMPLQPSVAEMAQTIANVASHEIGHLLGLVHTADPGGVMDVTASLRELLEDQQFNVSPIHAAVFPLGRQDAVRSLLDSVGGDEQLLLSRVAPEDPSVLRARIDSGETPARAGLYLSSCGLDEY